MSWGITINGSKEEANKKASEQSDLNIKRGYQTQEQKMAVLAVIDAMPGTHVEGSASGHNEGTWAGNVFINISSHSKEVP